MSNEWLLVISALVDVCVVFGAARLGSKWLFGTIAANLVLVSIFGAKLINVFGLVTNAGCVFYACVFLATHFILERKSMKDSLQTIWLGTAFTLFFLVMSQLAVHLSSASPADSINSALQSLFVLSPRIALASILAYIFAQYVNISLYTWCKNRTQGRHLWIRSIVANMFGQLVDSGLFFTIAFLDLSGGLLIQAIFAGWLVKVLVGVIGVPFLYLDAYLGPKK